MRLKEGFITHESDGQHTLVSMGGTGFSGLARGNDTAAFVIECLKKQTTPAQIADAMERRYDAPRERIEEGVEYVLEKLREMAALEE